MNYLDFLRTKIVSAPKSGTSVSADEISPVLKPHQRDAVKWALDLECKEKFFKDPQKLANALRRNYGFAGREFVERIQDEGIKRAEKFYNEFYSKLIDGDTTEKQAMAGAAVLTADALVTEWIFEDDRALTVKDIEPFLQLQQEVDSNIRGYQYLCDLVAVNPMRFNETYNTGEFWGSISSDGEVTMIRSIFGRLMKDGGFDDKSLLSWMSDRNLCVTTYSVSQKRFVPTKVVKINGVSIRCVLFTPKDLAAYDQFEYLGEQSDLL